MLNAQCYTVLRRVIIENGQDLIGAVINVGCLQDDDIPLKDISRHLHGGYGVAIPYEEYVIGRRNGIYIPKQMSRQLVSKEHLNS